MPHDAAFLLQTGQDALHLTTGEMYLLGYAGRRTLRARLQNSKNVFYDIFYDIFYDMLRFCSRYCHASCILCL